LRGILFSEFHLTAGPKVSFMAPENFMEKEVFDAVSSYIIPKPELKDRLITITTRDYKIVGCPVCMEDKKYDRNILMFNLCFVCTAQSKTKPIEPVVRKLADYLTTLETESGFVSNEATKSQIQSLIERILEDLNQTRRCSILVNDSVTIYLKVVDRAPTGDSDSAPFPQPPTFVREHDVPIFKPEFATMIEGGYLEDFLKVQTSLDMTTQQIIPFIDGFRHVKRISYEVDVDINLVKICLQNLLQFGYILIIPIFVYSNVYVATEDLDRLTTELKLWEECREFVAKDKSCKSGPVHNIKQPQFLIEEATLPTFSDVFTIFCAMNMGTRIKDLCSRHARCFVFVDVKRLVQFGLIHGLIRCVRKYPCLVPGENPTVISKRLRPLTTGRWLNGDHSLDEISCRTGIEFQELEDIIEDDPNIVTVMR